jgi:hypothetical protein
VDKGRALAVAALIIAGPQGLVEGAPVVMPSGIRATVCIVASPALTEHLRWSRSVMPEVNAIWERYGVHVRHVDHFNDSCNRCVVVKSDLEAMPRKQAADGALAWVPFVAGRARRAIYVRISRTIALAGTVGKKDAVLTSLLTEKLLARTLAHELGHILLDDRAHVEHGLMRARYDVGDVLAEPDFYTLSASQRARLASTLFGTGAPLSDSRR